MEPTEEEVGVAEEHRIWLENFTATKAAAVAAAAAAFAVATAAADAAAAAAPAAGPATDLDALAADFDLDTYPAPPPAQH